MDPQIIQKAAQVYTDGYNTGMQPSGTRDKNAMDGHLAGLTAVVQAFGGEGEFDLSSIQALAPSEPPPPEETRNEQRTRRSEAFTKYVQPHRAALAYPKFQNLADAYVEGARYGEWYRGGGHRDPNKPAETPAPEPQAVPVPTVSSPPVVAAPSAPAESVASVSAPATATAPPPSSAGFSMMEPESD